MNKLYVVSMIMLTGITLASAEEGNVVKSSAMLRGVAQVSGQTGQRPVPVLRNQNGGQGNEDKGQGQQGEGMRMMPPVDQMTTGDATIDAKIKSLAEERNAKIKAIQEEYATKMKSIIGNRVIHAITVVGAPGKMASSTVRKYMEERRNGSSTESVPVMMGRAGENEQNNNQRRPFQVKQSLEQNQPTGEGIIGFLKGMFRDK